MRVIEGSVDRELRAVAYAKAPEEAVGLLTSDDRVIILPNQASEPGSNFQIRRQDILAAIRMHEIDDLEGLTLWHSHPNGGVGPSRTDLQQKNEYFFHLVVTLKDNDAVYTWY